jgi:uncharacterized protein with HEPN domain
MEAAESALRFCADMDEQAFRGDEKTQRAVIQCIEVIGEAARNVTDQTRIQLPGVPWVQIVGMRHRIAHAYFAIDPALVWQVVAKDLHPLLADLRDWESKQ